MQKRYLLPALFLASAVLFQSCKKGDTGPAGPAGPTGPTGPSYTGSISGHVILYDQYGARMLTGLNAAQVALNGDGTSRSLNADTSGYYIFDSVKTGSYILAAQAAGYGSTEFSNLQYVLGQANRDIKMSAIPGFSPTGFTAYTTTSGSGDSLVLTFTADTRARNCIVFLNNNAAVYNLPSNYLIVYTKAIPANATRVIINVPKQDLVDAGFTSGQTVYYAAYGYVVNDVSAFEDITSGKTVYNAVSTTPIMANAIVP